MPRSPRLSAGAGVIWSFGPLESFGGNKGVGLSGTGAVCKPLGGQDSAIHLLENLCPNLYRAIAPWSLQRTTIGSRAQTPIGSQAKAEDEQPSAEEPLKQDNDPNQAKLI